MAIYMYTTRWTKFSLLFIQAIYSLQVPPLAKRFVSLMFYEFSLLSYVIRWFIGWIFPVHRLLAPRNGMEPNGIG